MSNLLAAIGRGQLRVLDERVAARRRINAEYREALQDLPGIAFMPEAEGGRATFWLTCITVDPERFGADVQTLRECLNRCNIEARPLWKPMHLQPVFAGARYRGRGVSNGLFATGLCLPSGSCLTDPQFARIVRIIRETYPALTDK
jgi:pyridoxal phosphate-dependent aminotransferase EpsN